MSFQGKTAVVTGASGGMGLQIALDLLTAGCRVTAIDVKEQPEELKSFSDDNLLYQRIDLADADSVEAAFDLTVSKFSRIHYLANVAGVLWFDKDKSLLEIDLDTWDQIMKINLKSMVHTIRNAVPHMKKSNGGSIVNFSTVQAIRGDRQPQDAYSASKGAVLSLTKSVAMQWGSDGIRCNSILPGPTFTPMQDRWNGNPDVVEAISNHLPVSRIGTAKDMSNACLFLLSDQSGFITGVDLPVDGGLSICC